MATKTRAIMTSIGYPVGRSRPAPMVRQLASDGKHRCLDGGSLASAVLRRPEGPHQFVLAKEGTMDRREMLAERPVERGRGFMPGISVNPSRVLFTAGL